MANIGFILGNPSSPDINLDTPFINRLKNLGHIITLLDDDVVSDISSYDFIVASVTLNVNISQWKNQLQNKNTLYFKYTLELCGTVGTFGGVTGIRIFDNTHPITNIYSINQSVQIYSSSQTTPTQISFADAIGLGGIRLIFRDIGTAKFVFFPFYFSQFYTANGWTLFDRIINYFASLVSLPPIPFDFNLSLERSSDMIVQGNSINNTMFVNLVSGTAENVNLSSVPVRVAVGEPSISVVFNPSVGLPTFSSVVSVFTQAITPQGTYEVRLTAIGGSVSKTIVYTLVIIPIPPPPPQLGTLIIRTEPVNGDIFVDNMFEGKGSFTGNFSPGTHIISLGDVKGYHTPLPMTVDLVAGQILEIVGKYQAIQFVQLPLIAMFLVAIVVGWLFLRKKL